MKESYVSYECAKRLKECRFDWKCDHYYCAFDNETDVRFWSIHPAQSNNGFRNPDNKIIADAPTLSLAQKWLREVKGGNVLVDVAHQPALKGKYFWKIINKDGDFVDVTEFGLGLYASYESALSAGIDAALKLLTEKK